MTAELTAYQLGEHQTETVISNPTHVGVTSSISPIL